MAISVAALTVGLEVPSADVLEYSRIALDPLEVSLRLGTAPIIHPGTFHWEFDEQPNHWQLSEVASPWNISDETFGLWSMQEDNVGHWEIYDITWND